jgi:heat shock protein HslJ
MLAGSCSGRHLLLRMPASLFPRFVLAGGLAAFTAHAVGDTPAEPNARLRDTRWSLQSLDGQAAVAGSDSRTLPYLVLRAKSQHLEGSTGCNRVKGRYTQRGTELALKTLATTRMACAPELMQQEQRLLEVLASTDGYRIEGRVLSLMKADVVKVTFSAPAAR